MSDPREHPTECKCAACVKWRADRGIPMPTSDEQAVAAERERCAKIAEGLSEKPGWSPNYKRAAKVIADMIRTAPAPNAEVPKAGATKQE